MMKKEELVTTATQENSITAGQAFAMKVNDWKQYIKRARAAIKVEKTNASTGLSRMTLWQLQQLGKDRGIELASDLMMTGMKTREMLIEDLKAYETAVYELMKDEETDMADMDVEDFIHLPSQDAPGGEQQPECSESSAKHACSDV